LNTENPELFTNQLDNGFIMEFNKEYCVEDIGMMRKEILPFVTVAPQCSANTWFDMLGT